MNVRHILMLPAMWLTAIISVVHAAEPTAVGGGGLAGQRPRLIVSTGIGGSDPDDFQSMVHLLFYADVLDIEGLVSSPPQQGRAKDINEVIDAYECDYPRLRSRSVRFPRPASLRAIVKQGATDAAPQQGWDTATEGSRWIASRAKENDQRPLWLLVWGSLTDVAQAIHDNPTIKAKIRVYSIGSWNTSQDRAARDYLFNSHTDLWWIESDGTFRGMYVGGDQSDGLGNRSFVDRHVKGHGALGTLFIDKKRDIKMGDTPSLLYLLRGDWDDPQSPHWGGAYVKNGHGANYWTDHSDKQLAERRYSGAKTVNQWRRDFLKDWQSRLDWTLKD